MFRCTLVAVALTLLSSLLEPGTPSARDSRLLAQTLARIDFARDVQPILRQQCVGCHGPSQQMNGLRLDRRRDAMRGGSASGVVIRPGNGAISPLYLKIAGTAFGTQMPPTGAMKPEQIAIIKQWIDEGADWPDALAGDVPPVPPDAGANAADRRRIREPQPRRVHSRADGRTRPSINKRGDGGTTPLMWAALERDAATVRRCSTRGADPNVRNDAGATALMWAIPDLADRVAPARTRRRAPNVKTLDGRTPLMRAAGIHGTSALVRRLLDARRRRRKPGQRASSGHVSRIDRSRGRGRIRTRSACCSSAAPIVAADGPVAMYFAMRANCTAVRRAAAQGLAAAAARSGAAQFMMPPNDDGRHLARLLEPRHRRQRARPEGRTLLMLAASTDGLPLDAVQALIATQGRHQRGVEERPHGRRLCGAARADADPRRADEGGQRARRRRCRCRCRRHAPHRREPRWSAACRCCSAPTSRSGRRPGCISCHNNTLTAETIAAARPAASPSTRTSRGGNARRWRFPRVLARTRAAGHRHPGRCRHDQLHPARPCG